MELSKQSRNKPHSCVQLIFDKGTKAIQWEEKCIIPNAVGVTGHRGQKIEAWTKSHTLQKNELKVNYELKCKI